MATHTNLPIYKVAYDLLDVVTSLVKNMQRDFKRSIGDKISTECIEITVLIFRANVAQDKAPHLLELALNEDLLNLCEHYLGCVPTLYSVHAWWTFARSSVPARTHSYHRDQDDHHFLSLFTYLTDVGPNDGPIDFLRGSHQPQQVDARIAEYRRSHPQAPAVTANHLFPPLAGDGYDRGEGKIPIPYDELFAEQRTTVVGPAGSAFLADTFALHRGNPPTAHHRLACWIRFGLAKSKTYEMDRTHRVPASLLGGRVPRGPQMDWVTRLVVDHGS